MPQTATLDYIRSIGGTPGEATGTGQYTYSGGAQPPSPARAGTAPGTDQPPQLPQVPTVGGDNGLPMQLGGGFVGDQGPDIGAGMVLPDAGSLDALGGYPGGIFPGMMTGGDVVTGSGGQQPGGAGGGAPGGGPQGGAGGGPIGNLSRPGMTAGANPNQPITPTAQSQQLQDFRQRLFDAILRMLNIQTGQGGQTPGVATPPDLFANAQQAIQAELRRQQQAQANEAAATGSAGSRDLAYRQGLIGANAAEAMGRVAPQWQAQQFNLAETQARTQAQVQMAQFHQLMQMLQSLGSFAR